MSVALTVATQYDVSGIVAASTGNTAVSAAAYAARAGLPCTLFVPDKTPPEKLVLARAFGARVTEVPGTFSDAYQAAAKSPGFNVTSTFINPFAVEGNKTVAYELFAQLGRVPEWIVVPIGAGPLLVACHKGFKELRQAGVTATIPRMVGVQAENCAPIVRAYREKRAEVSPWSGPCRTMASGIADPLTSYASDGTRTLAVIRESGGCAVGLGEDEIVRITLRLPEEEGVMAEPSAATSVAAVKKLKELNLLKAGDTVVCVVTGHGVKDSSFFAHDRAVRRNGRHT